MLPLTRLAASAVPLRAIVRRPLSSPSTILTTTLVSHPRSLHLVSPAPRRVSSSRRTYSTAPNQQQVFQSFSTPFLHFVQILSRVARIIVVSALSVVVLGGLLFEGTHQYVERVAMREAGASDGAEEYGWTTELEEEGWGRSAGTDSRLSSKGRHAVRSAWIASTWGAGISPYLIFSGPGAPGQSPRSSGGGGNDGPSDMSLYVEDGMAQAQSFLDLALREAEKVGIRLPDVAATRAGVANDGDTTLDPTALALEWRLASVRERLGLDGALRASIAGYVRIYDALSALPVKTSDGPRYAKAETMARLATRLADLEAAAGQREEAQRWLGVAGKWVEGVVGGPLDATLPRSTIANASPLGVRASIATLLSLSSTHASHRSLEQALSVQASALHILDEAIEGGPARTSSATKGGQLHALWLAYNRAVVKVHLAETSYALDRSGGGGSRVSGALSKVGLGAKRKDEFLRSKTLLLEADKAASDVLRALRSTTEGKKKRSQLDEKWEGAADLRVFAARLLRDAKRLRDEVKVMLPVLEGK